MIHGYRNRYSLLFGRLLRRTVNDSRKRAFCSGVSEKGTHVVFLHFGLPRTEFYAKGQLRQAAAIYYQVPKNAERFIPTSFLMNGKIRDCIAKYGESECIEESLNRLTQRIQGSLNTVMPEFELISCSNAFLLDEPSIEQHLVEVGKGGCSRIVLMPFYPHFSCAQSGALLNEAERVLQTFTVPSTIDGKEVPNERIVPNSSESFHVSALHRWSSHPVVSEYWLNILQPIRDNYGGVLFCAPALRGYNSREFRRLVWSSCERVMAGLSDSLPWKLAFFNAWDQWNLPVRDSVRAQAARLSTQLSGGKAMAVIPISSFVPDFNTFCVLPNLLKTVDEAVLLEPQPDSAVLLQGMVEVIKNHLLGRRNAQLRSRCNWCINSQCEQMRSTLIDS
ncbi:hypothetical protein RB195_007973 [Necator americanus]|uniref:Ferrochelatase n=1 Tax=Necator americanus TaxID=51031 RepID=A0ABR1C356_NECAM